MAYGAWQQQSVPVDEAEEAYENYWNGNPALKQLEGTIDDGLGKTESGGCVVSTDVRCSPVQSIVPGELCSSRCGAS